MSLPENSALVTYNPKVTSPHEICEWIDDMGFEAFLPLLDGHAKDLNECRIHIDGMTCNSCVQSIEG